MKVTEDSPIALTAKVIALTCMRDTFLEDLHAGTFPVSKTGDYTDVKVIDGDGREIPWNQLWKDISRLDDDEMKTLMKEVVNKLYTILVMSSDYFDSYAVQCAVIMTTKWDNPELDEDIVEAIRQSSRNRDV